MGIIYSYLCDFEEITKESPKTKQAGISPEPRKCGRNKKIKMKTENWITAGELRTYLGVSHRTILRRRTHREGGFVEGRIRFEWVLLANHIPPMALYYRPDADILGLRLKRPRSPEHPWPIARSALVFENIDLSKVVPIPFLDHLP